MTLSDLSHVFVTATVDESDIGGVRVGQAARITAASFPARTFAGSVTRIATKGVNSSNVVTFEVKVEVLDEHKDLLRPEMTGNVTIIQDERRNVLTLPPAAITLDGGKAFVTTADGQRRAVTLGLQGDELTEITSGVKAGDLLGRHRHPQLLMHVARPLRRAHAHHRPDRVIGPGSTLLAHELLARGGPDFLGVDQHAVEIEYDRLDHLRPPLCKWTFILLRTPK